METLIYWLPVEHASDLASNHGSSVFIECKERPGRDADPSPHSSAVVKKDYSYTSNPPMGRTACIEPQCLYSTRKHFTFLYI